MGIVSPEASSSVSSHPGSPGQSGEGGAGQGWGQKLQVLRRRRPRKRGQGVRKVEEGGVEELGRGGEWNELKGSQQLPRKPLHSSLSKQHYDAFLLFLQALRELRIL